jgi:hypothetical protein
MAVVPAPVAAVPVPVVVTPAYFLGLEAIDIVLGRDRGLRIIAARRHETLLRGNRRQRRGLRARSTRCGASGKSNGEFQKMAAFHGISLFVRGE